MNRSCCVVFHKIEINNLGARENAEIDGLVELLMKPPQDRARVRLEFAMGIDGCEESRPRTDEIIRLPRRAETYPAILKDAQQNDRPSALAASRPRDFLQRNRRAALARYSATQRPYPR